MKNIKVRKFCALFSQKTTSGMRISQSIRLKNICLENGYAWSFHYKAEQFFHDYSHEKYMKSKSQGGSQKALFGTRKRSS